MSGGAKKGRWLWAAGVGAIAALGVGGYVLAREPLAYVEMATGFGAKQLCSCLYVSERTSASCMAEFPAEARDQLTFTVSADAVEASALFGVISSRAALTPEGGCTIVK
jgi:hypothetical protein